MTAPKQALLATLAISALALGISTNPAMVQAAAIADKVDVAATTASTKPAELTNYSWTVQYCQDPGDQPCNSYRNMEPGDEFQVRNVSGSKDAALILVKHEDLTRYEFKAAIVSMNEKQLVLNFDDQVGKENSCKQLTVNLIKEHGTNMDPSVSCAQQLQDAGLKMDKTQRLANCAHPSVMNWSIASTGATPPNCLTASKEFRGFHAMSPPDPGAGSGTGRN